jgi:hypothetical protein
MLRTSPVPFRVCTLHVPLALIQAGVAPALFLDVTPQ